MLKNLQEQWQIEKDEYLNYLLENRFFKVWEKWEKDSFDSYTTLEIYLTSFCNQNCEYCYLKNNEDIYPSEYNDKNIILNNFRILLDYLVKKEYKINVIEIFSGDIWHTEYGLEVLQIFYEYLEKGLGCKTLMIPSNCYFATKYETLIPIQNFIDKYKYEKNVRLVFSISIDGEIVEDITRPLNNKEKRNEEYYENIFSFAKHNKFYFHPMISAFSIEKWNENYEWWKEKCKQYNINMYEWVMFLEVRNSDWTIPKIKEYNLLLEKMLEDFYNSNYICRSQQKLMDLFLDDWKDYENSIENYYPFSLPTIKNVMPCTVDKDLTVRVGDLAICPCHRLAQKNNIYGYFKVENNEIVGITAENIEIATRILLSNNNLCTLKCDSCIYNPLCLKGCFGSQKENTGDPFIIIESVCELFKNKISTILNWLYNKGIIDKLYDRNISEKGSKKAGIILQIWEHIKNEK